MGRRCWLLCATSLARGRFCCTSPRRAPFCLGATQISGSQPPPALQSIESEPVYTEHRCLSMPPPRPSPRPAHHGMACDAHAGLTRGTARPGTPSGWHRAWQSALPGAPGSGSSSGPCGGCKSFGRSQPNPENKPGGAAGGRSEGDVCRRAAPPQRGLETRFIPRWTQPSLGPGSWSSVMLGTSLRISSSLEPSSSSMVGSLSQVSRGGRRPLPSAVTCSQAGNQSPGSKQEHASCAPTRNQQPFWLHVKMPRAHSLGMLRIEGLTAPSTSGTVCPLVPLSPAAPWCPWLVAVLLAELTSAAVGTGPRHSTR